VTRDRVSTLVELSPPSETDEVETRLVELMDTGGYGVYTAEGGRFDDVGADLSTLTADIELQIKLATERASLILFVVDAQSGVTPLDQTIATMLRRAGHADKVLLVANKVDDSSWEGHAFEASALGFGDAVPVSALSGHMRRGLSKAIWDRLPPEASDETPARTEMRLAIVGRRNAGKSTLVNALAGEPRVIVSEIAGTTRDSVDVRIELDGHAFTVIDTAGVRKRKSYADDIEWYAHHRMLGAVRRADVVFLLIDATEEVTQVDKKLAEEVLTLFKPVVLVINKWDQVKARLRPEQYLDYLGQELPALSFAPIAFMSAASGEGVKDAMAMAWNLYRQAGHREPTARLNAAIQEILAQRGPTSRLGTRAKVLYVSQISVHPPTIVMVVNQPKLFEGTYERYFVNQLRKLLPYSEGADPPGLLAAQAKDAGRDEGSRRSACRRQAPARRAEPGGCLRVTLSASPRRGQSWRRSGCGAWRRRRRPERIKNSPQSTDCRGKVGRGVTLPRPPVRDLAIAALRAVRDCSQSRVRKNADGGCLRVTLSASSRRGRSWRRSGCGASRDVDAARGSRSPQSTDCRGKVGRGVTLPRPPVRDLAIAALRASPAIARRAAFARTRTRKRMDVSS
jgi:GTP-binding protein